MICTRCQGRMAYERFLNLVDGDCEFMGWRCINCGAIQDHVLVTNRLSLAKTTSRPRKGHWS